MLNDVFCTPLNFSLCSSFRKHHKYFHGWATPAFKTILTGEAIMAGLGLAHPPLREIVLLVSLLIALPHLRPFRLPVERSYDSRYFSLARGRRQRVDLRSSKATREEKNVRGLDSSGHSSKQARSKCCCCSCGKLCYGCKLIGCFFPRWPSCLHPEETVIG